MTTTELISSLRQLADWYEAHPELPVPYELEQPMFVFLYHLDAEQVRKVLREIGEFKKVYAEPSPDDFDAHKSIGNLTLRFHARRETVCKPRVVGKRTIERQVIPERVIEAHEEEVVEWDCEPILQDGK